MVPFFLNKKYLPSHSSSLGALHLPSPTGSTFQHSLRERAVDCPIGAPQNVPVGLQGPPHFVPALREAGRNEWAA